MGDSAPVPATARELRHLLLEVPEYRRRWTQHVQRRRGPDISAVAVARVLCAVDDRCPPASLQAMRDRVRRALGGEVIAPPTLRLFIEGFGFSVAEQEKLWGLLNPYRRSPAHLHPAAAGVYGGEPPTRILSRTDHLDVGPDRRTWRLTTTKTVQSVVDGLDRVPLMYGTTSHSFRPLLGCRIEAVAHGADGAPAVVHACFPRTLNAGDVHVYSHELDHVARTDGPSHSYAVGVATPTEQLVIQLRFTPPALPVRVYWRRWRTLEMVDENIVHEQEVRLNASHQVSWTQEAVRSGAGGFEWYWE